MKRPLAFAGFVFFATQLMAAYMPQQVVLPLAAVFSCLAIACVFIKIDKSFIIVAAGTIAVALFWRFGYVQIFINPILELDGQSCTVMAAVKENTNVIAGSAKIKIISTDNKSNKSFNVLLYDAPMLEEGDIVEMKISFKQPTKNKYYFNRMSKGEYLDAYFIDGGKYIKPDTGILASFRKLQSNLAFNIRVNVKSENGAIAAAMGVGDKSGLTAAIKESFQAAGLSHFLVVSGMHLSVVSGLVYAALFFITRKKHLSALVGIMVTVCFMLLTGLTPSVIRAGVTMIIVYLSFFAIRCPDAITSLGFAAALICIQNPYAAMDLGFLLSFSATFGIIVSNELVSDFKFSDFFIVHKKLYNILKFTLVPLSATIAALPILIVFDLGISVYSIFVNIIAVPILPILVYSSIIIGFSANIYFLRWFTIICAFLSNALINVLKSILNLVELLPLNTVKVSGFTIFSTVILLYMFIYFLFKWHTKYKAAYISVFIVICFLVNFFFTFGLVTIKTINSSQNSSVIISSYGKNIVILRSTQNAVASLVRYVDKQMLNIDYLIDLRKSDDTAEIAKKINSENYINAFSEKAFFINQFNDIIITIKNQGEASCTIIDINGFKVGMNNGVYNFFEVGALDIYICGQSRAKNIVSPCILSQSNIPKWVLAQNIEELRVANSPRILIRKGRSVKIYEEFYGFD